MSYAILKKHIDFIIKFGGIYAAIASFLTDFFKPVFNSTILFAILAGIMSCTIFFIWILKFISPLFQKINNEITKISKGFWFTSIFIASFLCFSMFSIMYYMNKNTPSGFFAEKSSAIKNLQEDFGIINKQLADIKANTDRIDQRTKNIEKDTKVIADVTNDMAKYQKKTVELLTESINPSDPKYKLNKMGIKFTAEEYLKKVLEGDLSTLKLFYEAGMSPNVLLPDHTNPIYTAILTQVNFPRKVLRQAINYGFNPNKELFLIPTNQMQISFSGIINSNFKGNESLLENADVNFNQFNTPGEYNLGFFLSLMHVTDDINLYYIIYDFNIDMIQGIETRNRIANSIKSGVNKYIDTLENSAKLDRAIEKELLIFNQNLSAFNKITNSFANPRTSIFKLNEEAAKTGQSKYIFQLAQCYDDGIGVNVDKSKAFKLYLDAADKEYPAALTSVGYCYEYGEGVEKNLTKAFEYYSKAANKDFTHAQYSIGMCYLLGLGTDQNYTEAVKYLTIAADKGNAHAQTNLGLCYIYGDGVMQDKEKGINLIKMAAAQGNKKANELLTSMHMN